MKYILKLNSFIRKIQPAKIVLTLLLSVVLLTATACNSGDELGARPNNSPVQMGGQNNPHKMGGDDMTQYKSPVNDSKLSKEDRAALPEKNLLAAANRSETAYPTDDDRLEGLLYSNSDRATALNSVDDVVSPQKQKELFDPAQIPAKKQPAIERSNPDSQILEKIGQMFDDAGNFSAN